jgi:hypothetical protein
MRTPRRWSCLQGCQETRKKLQVFLASLFVRLCNRDVVGPLGDLDGRIVGRKLRKVRCWNGIVDLSELALDLVATLFLHKVTKPLEEFLACFVAEVEPNGTKLGGYFLAYLVPTIAVARGVKPVSYLTYPFMDFRVF